MITHVEWMAIGVDLGIGLGLGLPIGFAFFQALVQGMGELYHKIFPKWCR